MQMVVAFSASLSSVFWSDLATALSRPVVGSSRILMPAPLNVRFNIQSYQDFKRTFCGPGWAAAVFFVDRAIALQRQYGNY